MCSVTGLLREHLKHTHIYIYIHIYNGIVTSTFKTAIRERLKSAKLYPKSLSKSFDSSNCNEETKLPAMLSVCIRHMC